MRAIRPRIARAGTLVALALALTACDDSDRAATSTEPRSTHVPATTQVDAASAATTTVDVAAFCGTIDLGLISGLLGRTAGPVRIVEGACVIDSHTPVGAVTMRPYVGADVLELRARLEEDSAVQRFIPQGVSDTAEPYPTTYFRGQHTVWRIGVDNRNAIVLTTEHCCVEAQRDMLLRIIWQHRV